MGEIADMIIEGILDSETGEYIDDEHSRQGGPGFPRTMNDRRRVTYNNPSVGVKNYLGKHAKSISKKDRYEFCLNYVNRIIEEPLSEQAGWEEVASIIQQDFGRFVKYVKRLND